MCYYGIGMEASLDETMWDRIDLDLDVALPTFNGIDEESEIPFV